MLRRLSVVAILLLGFASQASADDLNAILTTALKGTQAPAAGILVMQDGKVTGVAVQGLRRNDRPDQVQTSDVWHIGSDAKAMTATLISKLVDRGVLRWDTPLAKMLPDLAATMRPEYRTVTLVQLLSHRSGLPHDASDQKFIDAFQKDTRPMPAQRMAYIARALQDKPVAPPGTKFSYSNTGFITAAAIAEHATGKAYEDLMRREVFTPLGITSEGIGVPEGAEPRGHVKGKPILSIADANPLFFAPAGNWYLSLQDWAKFCLDQMAGAAGHGRLLKTESYRFMQTLHGEAGLGRGVDPTVGGRQGPFLVHSGSDGTWFATLALLPGKDSGVLTVSNAGPDMGGDKVAQNALKAELPMIAPPAPKATAPSH